MGRLRRLGAVRWPRDAPVLEAFCGRGNGLHALERLGFTNLTGADLSADLLEQYDGPAETRVCDCRALPWPDDSFHAVIIQGGLHHLTDLPGDLERCLDECHRVLQPNGKLLVVEPWNTPFLHVAHWLSEQRWLRRCWPRLDAFADMTENEAETYANWLGRADQLLECFGQRFGTTQLRIGWGKLNLVGVPSK